MFMNMGVQEQMNMNMNISYVLYKKVVNTDVE